MRKHLQIVDRHKASLGTRFANSLLDGIFIQVIYYGSLLVFGIIYAIIFGEAIDSEAIEEDTAINLAFTFLYITFHLCYYILMEYYLGKTIAKYITGTKVISIDGNNPTIGQIVGRTFSRLVPFDALSFLGENGWHDSWSDTRVINIKKYQAEKQVKSEIDSLGEKEFA
ncbi:RDD family protein [Chryseobacterium oryctis]|uniref:RDD family protein n=1 Tax=Chryseobacterium oryctis TaxID=2952618 RepID=A0ABT3HK77_9FLAO|nr:RDD family protein [Chryseobacterium oryctis]MCW3160078.1 RDD family protein [Chryseobacterium oryctis]